jgi:antitoxin (DNA-binding transcriptional repressor) of toxin-antitoxin stability system
MSRKLTATEAKAKFLALLDEVEAGDEIEITRHGVAPARGPHALKGLFRGVVTSSASDEELFSTRETWNAS